MDYVFSDKTKKITLGVGVAGLLLFLLGILFDNNEYTTLIADDGHNYGSIQRIWVSLLTNSIFFFFISLAMLFFVALQYAAEVSWSVVFKRVYEAIMSALPIMAALVVLIVAVGQVGGHHIYHWQHYEVGSGDHLLDHKAFFFSPAFYWPVLLFFMASFLFFVNYYRKQSLKEDEEGGTRIHFKNFAKSALFLVIFGYGSSVITWQIIMSIDAHWFSTLFGWYVFSGMWLVGMVYATLLIIFLKSKGLLGIAKNGHLHDMGKWMFALSFLWTYLFFSQFMLIWYADIPEETTYYIARINDYPWLYWGMFFLNFAVPMLALMDADAKINRIALVIVGSLIIIFHWIDVFMMISPGAMKTEATIGILEIGSFFLFLGMFTFIVLKALAGRPLVVKNHPYLDEGKNIHH